MQRVLSSGLVLALSTVSLSAQLTISQTLAKGFETTDGGYYCFVLGNYSDGRVQFMYGDWRKSVLTIKGF